MTHHKTTITQDEYYSEIETALPRLQHSSKAGVVIGNIQKHVKACVFALSVALTGGAYADDDTAKGADIALASTSQAASVDAEGVVHYSAISVAEIQEHINSLQAKIDGLKKRPLSELSDAEFDILIGYQEEILSLEDLQTKAHKESIREIDKELVQEFKEINDAINDGS